jgi:glucose-1-phosphatase
MDIRLTIFDLGRVVFAFDWMQAFAVWRRHTSVPAGMTEADLDDEVHARFERGEISAAQFHAHAVRAHDLCLTFEQFAEGWNAIYGRVYPEVDAALRQLSGRSPIVAFTNTNELHRPAWTGRYDGVLALFDHVYVSSQIGHRKPERAGFEHIVGQHGATLEQALFFDDMEENVAAARGLGIHAVRVRQPADVVRGLQKYGLFPG